MKTFTGASAPKFHEKRVRQMLGSLQKLGKALMLPVAVLPAAALAMKRHLKKR